jgi:hypothetical protein
VLSKERQATAWIAPEARIIGVRARFREITLAPIVTVGLVSADVVAVSRRVVTSPPPRPASMTDTAQANQGTGEAMEQHLPAMIEASRRNGDTRTAVLGELWQGDGHATHCM